MWYKKRNDERLERTMNEIQKKSNGRDVKSLSAQKQGDEVGQDLGLCDYASKKAP